MYFVSGLYRFVNISLSGLKFKGIEDRRIWTHPQVTLCVDGSFCQKCLKYLDSQYFVDWAYLLCTAQESCDKTV